MNERQERQRFEQFAAMPPREWDTTRWPDDDRYSPYPNCYVRKHVQCAWEAWIARAEAENHKAIHEEQ